MMDYNKIMDDEQDDLPELFGEDDSDVGNASLAAIADLHANGIDVVYLDRKINLPVVEKPNGQRFEIHFIGSSYEIVRELSANA
jgi:hypothetical protein